MRLIIPIQYYRLGGVEKVINSVIGELVEESEQVVMILPDKTISHFQKKLPPSPSIKYESFSWPRNSIQSKIIALTDKISCRASKLYATGLQLLLTAISKKFREEYRINYLIRQYQSTHCLYFLTNRLTPPNLEIPLAMISHDVFWRFAPLTYSESYVKEYDSSLLEWLNKVDLVLTVSEKTRRDILSIWPDFSPKIKTIPNSGFQAKFNASTTFSHSEQSKEQPLTFYYPSSFGIYKYHLILLRAGIKLAQKNLPFKIVMIGKETDNLIAGKIGLSQQSKTQEYVDYLHQCQQIFQNHQNLIRDHFEGLGYCDDRDVENWYQKSSCVVVPSKYEGFGLALSEAIVRGLPVIASDLEVFREQVELYKCDDRVDFFGVGDVDALADCMEQFILSPKHKLSTEEIDTRFSHWTWNHVAREYINSLQQLSKS